MSDVIESLACGFEDPYEVISSQDMLSRFEDYNRVLEKDIIKERDKGIDYDWRDEKMLIGSDVVALFPSLSKANTIKAVKSQLSKSKVEWENLDVDWMRLYIHLNRGLCENIESVKKYLPYRRPGRRGVEA